MKNKKFDCVELKRKSQEIIYSKIKDMNQAEELEFWQKGLIELRNLQHSAKENQAKSKRLP